MANLFDNKIDAYIVLSADNRFYFTDFHSSFGCVLLTQTENIFFTDSRYLSEAMQNIAGYNIIDAKGITDLYNKIIIELKRSNIKSIGFEDKTMTVAEYKIFKTFFSDFTLKPASQIIENERLIKSSEEIEKVRLAQSIAQKSLKKIIPLIKVGITEKELASELMFECMREGAESMSFDTIVAFEENSAIPHHQPSNKKLEKNHLILIDFGIKYQGYCSDMTRTFCLNEPNSELAVIHNIILEAQNYALKHIKAGMSAKEVDSLAREYIRANGYDSEFSHSLGHGVGIEIHEAPRLSESSDEILQIGMIVTIEPGVYVDGLGGVRIEDIGAITEDGFDNFTDFDKNIKM